MRIIGYKKKGLNKYLITTDERSFILYDDIIVKHNLLLKKNIDDDLLEIILKENEEYEGYYVALKYIKSRIRSKKEILELLKENQYDPKYIDLIIKRLEKEGYVNDDVFCKAYINDKILLTNSGPLKIEKNLYNLGIEEEMIEKYIAVFDQETIDKKIEHYLEVNAKTNTKSNYIFKNKMISNLINLGYSKEDVNKHLNVLDINDEENYKKEYKKEYKKLSVKYSGAELDSRLKQKMYQKGYRY